MRYTKDHKTETHSRIVKKAGERFRSEGVDAVGVASLMESVGLTAGGFYAHFTSKEALIAEACYDGFAESISRFRQYIESRPKGERMAAFVSAYLSRRHRDEPEQGCFIAANGAEIARHPQPTRAALTSQLNTWIALIQETMTADGLKGDARGIAGAMVGALVMARTVDDPALSDSFLESGRQTVLASLKKTDRQEPV
jgi:TetR/AcrR family transcriptional repressor of nem operon